MEVEEFERLVAPLRNELVGHCYRMLGSYSDAEDAFQESLVRAWRALDRFDDRGLFRAWLYRISTNRCLTMLQQRGRRALPVDIVTGDNASIESEWLEPFPGAADTSSERPDARYDSLETIELAFVAVLQELPSSQRAVLLLRDVIGFSSSEAADLLEMTTASVNSALQRARSTISRRSPTTSQQTALRSLGSDGVRKLADRYAAAWEAGDVDAILALLAPDARYSMPPVEEWFHGREAIRDFLLSGPLQVGWRFVQTIANGQLAFGTYAWDATQSVFRALALDVVAIQGDEISEVVSFLTPDVFASFGLPDVLPE